MTEQFAYHQTHKNAVILELKLQQNTNNGSPHFGRMIVEKREIGHVVCRFLEGADWTPFEHNLLNMVQPNTADDPVDMRTLLLLCWLRHVAANLKKTSHSATHWVWVTWNIESVLKCI